MASLSAWAWRSGDLGVETAFDLFGVRVGAEIEVAAGEGAETLEGVVAAAAIKKISG